MTESPAKIPLKRISLLVEQHAGLFFPPDKEAELERGLSAAAEQCCGGDAALFADGLLAESSPSGWRQALVEQLTVGETYFFREEASFQLLETRLLTEILPRNKRRPHGLTVWSAACSTGEEAYSLATMLDGICPPSVPGRPAFSILATDINRHSLAAACRGIYREWSFRGTSPEWRQKNFRPSGGPEWEVLPRLRDMIAFHPFNLVQDTFLPDPWQGIGFDILFCRNVLMYFSKKVITEIVARLVGRLAPEGILVFGASEAALVSHTGLAALDADHCWVFHRGAPPGRKPRLAAGPRAAGPAGGPIPPGRPESRPAWRNDRPARPAPAAAPPPTALPQKLFAEGRHREALAALGYAEGERSAAEENHLLATRCLANLGRHAEALAHLDQLGRENKLSPSLHFLRAGILEEMRRTEEAEDALKRCLFCDPAFVAAHFSLGNLCRGAGRLREARKHYENTLELLSRLGPHDMVAEPGIDMTAGRLAEYVQGMLRLLLPGKPKEE